jgi:hypothetical protein
MPLPYQGYDWSLTQHENKINPKDVYALVAAARAAKGKPHPNRIANSYLAELSRLGLITLTPNLRRSSPQPWRDYQQVLPELGLMISTRISHDPELTRLGLMFLDSNIGFDELLTTQVLRYQFPNGQKSDRLDLDRNAGVLIRPAVLVARVLIELQRGQAARVALGVDDVCSLLPTRMNREWPFALEALRRRDRVHGVYRRHLLDWLKLLGKCLIFSHSSQRQRPTLSLSQFAIENVAFVEKIVATLEQENTFWIPPNGTPEARMLSWFHFFGEPNLTVMWSPPDESVSNEYLAQNYLGGVSLDDTDRNSPPAQIHLRDFDDFVGRLNVGQSPTAVDVAGILAGRQKQGQSSVLHDDIVRKLGLRLQNLNYNVRFDPSSIDVYAQKDGMQTILEVKTLGPRNVANRLRLGTGQLIEYRRRFELQNNSRPECVLVIGAPTLPTGFGHWEDVLHHDARIGLIGYNDGGFVAHSMGAIEREITGV